jgi:hypothetical protein
MPDEIRRSPDGRWLPGQYVSPSRAKKVGSRDKLSQAFVVAFAADFDEHGVAVIERVRNLAPVDYLKIVASMMPKEVKISRPLEDVPDDELDRMIAHVRAAVAADAAGIGEGDAGLAEPDQELSAVH